MRWRRAGWTTIGLAAVVAGCARPVVEPSAAPAPGAVSRVVGRSVEGRAIEMTILGSPRPVPCDDGRTAASPAGMAAGSTVLLIGSIHGDEPSGTPLLAALVEHLAARPTLVEGRTVLVIEVANPDGLARNRRTNAHGVDLNRNVDGASWRPGRARGAAPVSEPEAAALMEVIERWRPDRVVSIHQPLACIDYDGPAGGLAGAMGEACGLPVRRLGALPGSLGSYVGRGLGRPIVTMELPAAARRLDREALWRRYGPALLVAIGYEGG
ncbi:MAG: DUF2817 domain-containing protein [Planctomycetota bacterium]|jgi:protein MpaA